MPPFNPQVQYAPDPNYLNYPRVVDAPEVNVNAAQTISNVGKGFEGFVSGAKQTIDQSIDDKAHALVDPERDAFTAGLEKVKAGLDNGTIAKANPNAVTGSATNSLFDAHAEADDADLPPGLQSGLDRVEQLAQAYGVGSPKINDTSYSAATLSIAKQLRSQYPGFRDEVDAAVSKASGLPVANSYYQNLMTDINRQLFQLNRSTKDDMPAIMRANLDVPGDANKGVPNMGILYNLRKTDPQTYQKLGGDAFVLSKIADWRNIQTQQTIDAKIREQNNDDKKTQIETETANLNSRATDVVSHFITDNIALSGMAPLRELSNYMSQVGSTGMYNGVKQGGAEVEAHAQQLTTYRAMIKAQLQSTANGSARVIGDDQVDKILEKALSPIDTWISLAKGSSGDNSLAGYQLRQNKNIQEDDTNRFLFNTDKDNINRQILVGRRLYGDTYFPIFLQGALGHDISNDAAALFQQEALTAVVPQPDQRGAPLPQRTMKDAVLHAKQVGVPDQNIYGKFVGLATGITDPKMPLPMKDQLIKWAFDPKNAGLVDEFRQDYRDQNGNWVQGKMAAIQRLASPAMSASVAATARDNPDNYTMYRGTVEHEFGLALRTDLSDLNKVLQKPYLNAHFGWDDQTGHFMLVDNNNRSIVKNERVMAVENPNQVYINGMVDRLDNVNKGIDALTNVYTNDPTNRDKDVGRYLLNTLQTIGFRPGENITNASEGMAKAIIKTKKPEATLEDLDKTLGLR